MSDNWEDSLDALSMQHEQYLDAKLIHDLETALTAAQSRVAELEQELASSQLTALESVYDKLVCQRIEAKVPMAMGKHAAANAKYCQEIIEELQAAGHHSAADWAIWMLWWRMMDWQTAKQVDDMRLEDNARLRELLREWCEFPIYATGLGELRERTRKELGQ